MPKEEISMRQKIVVEVLDHLFLGGQIEIDQDIAAEDDVHSLHESHAGIVRQIQPAETNAGANGLLNLQLISGCGKVLLTKMHWQIPRAVVAVDGVFGVCERALVQIGGKYFDRPVL